jgi:hypothetical protein
MNYLFIWIPKTSGTSIFEAMKVYHGMKLYLDDYHKFENKGSVSFGHLDVSLLMQAGIISKDYWNSVRVFTVVRNPYDRFISLWSDFVRTSRVAPQTTPLQFAQALLNMPRNPGLKNAFGFSQCASQVKWILPGVMTYRYEDRELLPVHTEYLNSGNNDNWINYYDSELVSMVTELYRDDLILLNYPLL